MDHSASICYYVSEDETGNFNYLFVLEEKLGNRMGELLQHFKNRQVVVGIQFGELCNINNGIVLVENLFVLQRLCIRFYALG